MKTFPRLVTFVVIALLGAGCGSDDTGTEAVAPAADGSPPAAAALTITPGRANWPTGYFQAAVYSALLEELGFVVEDPAAHEYPPPDAYLAMAEGTIDFWANGWYSQHITWHERKLDDGTTVGDHLVVLGHQVPAGALEGLVITKQVADRHGIASLAQIDADPELVALFDGDGNGLAEVFGCPEDWTCDDIIDELIAFNRWSNIEQVKAGYPGLVSATIDRVRAGEPAIQYTWSPSGYLTELIPGETVVWLSVGDRANVLDGSTAGGFDFADADPAPLGSACSEDPCWLGWEPSDIQVTANREFADANPVAVALFEVVALPVGDISTANARYDAGENTEADVRRHADEWIAANRELVDQWLSVARPAGG